MRRVDRLIDQVRRQTENQDFSDTTGIDTVEFLQYMNDAQHRLQGLILQQHPSLFQKESTIDIVANTETYTIPADAFLFNKIVQVEYSPTGREEDYYPLQLISLKNRNSGINGHPLFYIRKSGQILLNPIPQTSVANIRLTYIKRIDNLDIRRGQVDAVTLTSNSVTVLNIDPSSIDATALNQEDYICVVNKDGLVKMRNIPISFANETTGEITLDAGFTFETGETIAIGDYVVGGKDATTHSELPRTTERYLLAYCAWKIFARDSSVDVQEQTQELLALERDLVDSFADIEDDVQYVTILTDWDREGYN